jgi:hypothetical protein
MYNIEKIRNFNQKFNKCNEKFKKYIETEDKAELEDCVIFFDNIFDTYEQKTEIINDKCIILSKKRKDKYIHKYDVSNILNKICKLKTKLPEEYLDVFINNFEIKPRENCCNCISIVLYSTLREIKLSYFLPNLLVSLKNINQYLPDWIMRIYLDNSVFRLIYIILVTNLRQWVMNIEKY